MSNPVRGRGIATRGRSLSMPISASVFPTTKYINVEFNMESLSLGFSTESGYDNVRRRENLSVLSTPIRLGWFFGDVVHGLKRR